MRRDRKQLLGWMALAIMIVQLPAIAYDDKSCCPPGHRPVTLKEYLADHPKTRSALMGAGVGSAAGAVTGLVTGRGVLHGAAVGAGAGAGIGLIRSSAIMSRHPIVRDLATGGAIGAGLGWAGGRHDATVGKAAGAGAALGLGAGMLGHM